MGRDLKSRRNDLKVSQPRSRSGPVYNIGTEPTIQTRDAYDVFTALSRPAAYVTQSARRGILLSL